MRGVKGSGPFTADAPQIRTRLTAELEAAVTRVAAQRRMTRAEIAREALARYVDLDQDADERVPAA